MELNEKKVLVVGLGRTGIATARFLIKRGAGVTVTDMASEGELGDYPRQAREMGITMELGRHRVETFNGADLVIISPGVPHTIAPVLQAKENGIRVMGEMEMASRFIQEPLIAVTGTNGKTTTTRLLGDMLEQSGLSVFAGGNIGRPLIGYVDNEEKAQIIVAEVSSFQLDTIETFHPRIAVLLNIAEDHLDRYADFTDYFRSKFRIFENQDENDTAILNGSDPRIRLRARNISGRKLFFGNRSNDEVAATITPEKIVINFKGGNHIGEELIIDRSQVAIPGEHNSENIAAASLAALTAGATPRGVTSAVANFRGISHRLEYIDTIDGVRFFNDSKATNTEAVVRALECFNNSVVLILGGRNKGGNFNLLSEAVGRHVTEIIALGEATPDILAALSPIVPVTTATTMQDAVVKAAGRAVAGNVVLLSPACSSFDMYTDYAHRGTVFAETVKNLKKMRCSPS
jgi:UDP-N-acetylmuramoylalanine--D-glutamate ligase